MVTLLGFLLQLAGSIALLLWGVYMIQTGIQRAFGPRLRAFLSRALGGRFQALLAGLGVTAILQSSTATGLMVTGFTAGGMLELVPALAIMLGAHIGSTLIVQVFSFNVMAVAPVLILVGVVTFRRRFRSAVHDLGRVFIGLGLMIIALHQLLDEMARQEQALRLDVVLGAIAAYPLLNVLLSAIVTWATHSSVAVVLLVMSLAVRGLITSEAAFALVLGANLGTAVNPVLEGSFGDDPAARRLPVGNLIIRAIGVLVVLPLLGPLSQWFGALRPNMGRAVADFHTLFNVALALVFLPLLGPCARGLRRLMPSREDPDDPGRPRYLDAAARQVPDVALGGAARESLRLADVLGVMLDDTAKALTTRNRHLIAEIRRRDDELDRLHHAIKAYLTSIDPRGLREEERHRLHAILVFAMNIEQAGDVIDRNLLSHAGKILKRGLTPPRDIFEELIATLSRLQGNLTTAASLFVTKDPRTARLLADEKVRFRELEAQAAETHFARYHADTPQATQANALCLDLLRDMKIINSHLVAAVAYPILEQEGELLTSRVADGLHETHA